MVATYRKNSAKFFFFFFFFNSAKFRLVLDYSWDLNYGLVWYSNDEKPAGWGLLIQTWWLSGLRRFSKLKYTPEGPKFDLR